MAVGRNGRVHVGLEWIFKGAASALDPDSGKPSDQCCTRG